MDIERHHFRLVVLAVIAPSQADPGPVGGNEPAVGDCHAVGVAAEIGEDLLGRAEGRLGIDDPVHFAQGFKSRREGPSLGQSGQLAEEAQLSRIECCL